MKTGTYNVILAALPEQARERTSVDVLAYYTGFSATTVRRYVEKMVDRGEASRSGSQNKRYYWRVHPRSEDTTHG